MNCSKWWTYNLFSAVCSFYAIIDYEKTLLNALYMYNNIIPRIDIRFLCFDYDGSLRCFFFLCNTKNIAVIQRNITHNIWDAWVFNFHTITIITWYISHLFWSYKSPETFSFDVISLNIIVYYLMMSWRTSNLHIFTVNIIYYMPRYNRPWEFLLCYEMLAFKYYVHLLTI